MTQKEDQLDHVVRYSMANRSMDAMQRYATAGRPYRSLGSDELAAMFIARFRKWVAEFNKTEQSFVDDLSAEYELRGEDPPYQVLENEIVQLNRRIKGVLANATPDRMKEVGEKLLNDYQTALKAKH